jgi:hypothetical protein
MTAFSPASEILSLALRDLRMAQDIFSQWAGNNAHGTQVPRQCLDAPLSRWEDLKRLDIRGELQPLESHFSELAACRERVVGHWASEVEKRSIIPRVERCLGQVQVAVEGLVSSMAV